MLSKPLIALAALASPLVQGASLGHDPRSVVPRFSVHIGDRTKLLNDDVVQKGSTLTGMEESSKPEDGQSASQTDKANFINHCSGKTLTDGQMKEGGSCNPISMGDIPSVDNMISTVITYPLPGDTVAANKDFTVSIQTHNLATGHFTNPLVTYYSAPQALDESGKVLGHSHLVIQELDSLRTTTPPPPTEFVFFAGVNDKSEDGVLSANVQGGLPAGAYRLCTLVAAANHQPVLMPVPQRGGQDDCVRFEVVEGTYKREENVQDGGVGACECPVNDVVPENPVSPEGDVAPEAPTTGVDGELGGNAGVDQELGGSDDVDQALGGGDDSVAPEAPVIDEELSGGDVVPEAPAGNVDQTLGGDAGVDQELGGSDGADQALGGNTDVVAPESPVIDEENPTGAGGADQALDGADGADGSLEAPADVDGNLSGNDGSVDQALGGADAPNGSLEARDSFDDDVLSVNLDATIGDGFGF